MFENEIKVIHVGEAAIRKEKYQLFKKGAKLFMRKYKTNKIYFDEEGDRPSLEYIGGIDSDIHDAFVKSITFDEDGDIAEFELYLYYECEDVVCDRQGILNLDYLFLLEYIDAQLNDGLYEPLEDLV